MLKKTILIASVVGLCLGCDLRRKEAARLHEKADSLRVALESNNAIRQTLQSVGELIDSIDANRFALRARMVDGVPYEDYAGRMRDINNYVKETQKRLTFLEQRLSSFKNTSSGFTGTIKKLRHELDSRTQELDELSKQVANYRNERDNLVQTTELQKAELTDKQEQLKTKEAEVAKLESDIKDLQTQTAIDKGENYFVRAVAMEETANRTHFAPRKKKNTQKEALNLYKLAVFYGKAEAQTRVDALEKKF
jgi:chromosome segregation ATPase